MVQRHEPFQGQRNSAIKVDRIARALRVRVEAWLYCSSSCRDDSVATWKTFMLERRLRHSGDWRIRPLVVFELPMSCCGGVEGDVIVLCVGERATHPYIFELEYGASIG